MSKINRQKIKSERKLYKQQIEELKKRLDDLTQAIEMLKTPNSLVTEKAIKVFMSETYSKPPKKNNTTNKTDVFYINNIWTLDILDLRDYGCENNRGYRYVLVVFDIFSKNCWTVPLKNKNAQTIKVSFENILIKSKRKPNLIQTDGDKTFHNNFSQNILNTNNIKNYSRNTYLGAVFAERIDRTILDLLKRPVFEKG